MQIEMTFSKKITYLFPRLAVFLKWVCHRAFEECLALRTEDANGLVMRLFRFAYLFD